MFAAEKFQCPNKEDYVYFRFGEKLELQNEFDTLLIGSLENGKVLNSKRYGQGFLEYGDGFMGITNDKRYEYVCENAKSDYRDVNLVLPQFLRTTCNGQKNYDIINSEL